MEKFNSIYPFTTENIAGYMKKLDLENKKVITVTASGDHILNLVVKGCKYITAYDINPLAQKYAELKLAGMRQLDYKDFLKVFLYETSDTLKYEIIKSLELEQEISDYWITELKRHNNNGLELRKSILFNTKYFNPASKIKQNLYLDEENYQKTREKLSSININYINTDIKDLKLSSSYDYMFLSNISDYLNQMFTNNYLEKYANLLNQFSVENIYFAYLYDIYNKTPRSIIDNISEVKKVFRNMQIEQFDTALENANEDAHDAVLILKKR
ncbi:MAG: DUF3419 family protein [Bacilli bacterium]|nr:DUF3419 family protein [Bacilli bacterium]